MPDWLWVILGIITGSILTNLTYWFWSGKK